jgi:hypothetical protein
MRSHPRGYLSRRFFILQLSKHCLRNDDVCIKMAKHGDMVNQDKVIDGGGIGDNNAHSD